ncbi:MAG: YkgJ family cysteine cluster protein [Deltaproteobacteria bacterium]|nr:YkgJ family cysteine cluster protein [Deltaproteobacteria bacterium]MBI3296360.1 YkgJ family cysteine cluster protein [Deltaproteobacteria bacterium]
MKRSQNEVAEFFLSRLRTGYYIVQILPPFFATAFSTRGFGSAEGRQQIWGKARRILISLFPPFARFLQAHYGLSGGCVHCSSSCKLLFQCPHWDDKQSRCGIYEDRPSVCRLFPITPGDIKDRNLVNKEVACGFRFNPAAKPPRPYFPKGVSPRFPR